MSRITLLDKELDELYKKTAKGQKRGERIGGQRKILAYILKGIAAGGSLLIATGLLSPFHQGIGIAVLVAIFIDTLFSNHKRLIADVEAGYAFRALSSRVKGEFNRKASSLYQKIHDGDHSAQEQIEELKKKAHVVLSDGIEIIQKNLEKADIEALKSLSLDQERSSIAND